ALSITVTGKRSTGTDGPIASDVLGFSAGVGLCSGFRIRGGSMTTFRDRHCFVTGAASGIGRATALALAAQGAWLSLTDIQPDALTRVADEVRQRGGRVLACRALDFADYSAVRAFA